MNRQTISVVGAIALLGGCVITVPGVLDAGGDEDTAGEADTDDPTNPMDTTGSEPEPEPTDSDGCTEALDILVVIDNSGSMAPFQRRLTDAFPILIDGLDAAGVDWRLAFTTTDNGNMWCVGENATPEHGQFVFSPCTSRLGDFLFGNDTDVTAQGCTDICGVDPALLAATPTFTEQDQQLKPRPWLQRENGQLNVAADVSDALRCLLPQGVNGCGFEQPLESMWRGLARTTMMGEPEFGFLREHASLLILLVSDEADCSSRPEFDEIFAAEGERVFWSNPDAPVPSSAVCWNAGVDCTGDPEHYDDCVAVNKDVHGDPSSAQDAVLYPVSRYQNTLAQIEAYKQSVNGDEGLDVAVLAISGIRTDGSIVYSKNDSDPVFLEEYGIGVGCTDNVDPFNLGSAVPPVRIREVAEHLSMDPLASICATDFEAHLQGALDHFVGACE